MDASGRRLGSARAPPWPRGWLGCGEVGRDAWSHRQHHSAPLQLAAAVRAVLPDTRTALSPDGEASASSLALTARLCARAIDDGTGAARRGAARHNPASFCLCPLPRWECPQIFTFEAIGQNTGRS